MFHKIFMCEHETFWFRSNGVSSSEENDDNFYKDSISTWLIWSVLKMSGQAQLHLQFDYFGKVY